MGDTVFVTSPGLAPAARDGLERAGCRVLTGGPSRAPRDIARWVAECRCDGLIVRTGSITREVLAASPALRVVCKHGTGTDTIDVAAATELGIPVLFTPGANAGAVAEHSLALILALLRGVVAEDRRVRAGVFEKKGYGGVELGGKTLGLVGFGRVARRLSELVAAFDCPVVAHDPVAPEAPPPAHVRLAEGLDEVYSAADVLSLHCPLTAGTRGMIDESAIAAMKPGVFLVNTARGGLVNEHDLAAALQNGRVAAAALDVFEAEPPAGSPLLALQNVVLTPHVAGMSDVATVRTGLAAAAHVLAALRDEPLDRAAVVNPAVLGS